MRKLNKKAIELQINFIVIMVITLIIFAFSIVISTKILKSTNKLKGDIDSSTQDRLEAIMTSGNEEVVIPFNKKDGVKPGDNVVFGLGILNTLGGPKTFSIKITPSTAIDSAGNTLNPAQFVDANWFRNYDSTPKSVGQILNNAHKNFPLIFVIPPNVQSSTTYVFNVEVTYDESGTKKPYPQNDPIKKVRITIQ